MAAVTISRSAGRLIAVKAVPAGKAAELEREAALLRRLDHPGLVRCIDLVTDPDGTAALHTEFVSSDTWATRPLADPAERAAGVAALASTVADLHDLGITHGQLTPAHVLHGENDRPVVCSLTRTSEATTQTRRADLLALADLCDDPPLPRGTLAGNVAALADSTRAGKLSARELSRRLELLRSKRTPVSHPVQAARPDTPKRRNRTALTVAAVVLAVVVAFTLGSWRRQTSPPLLIDSTTQTQPGIDPTAGPQRLDSDSRSPEAGVDPADAATDPAVAASGTTGGVASPSDGTDPATEPVTFAPGSATPDRAGALSHGDQTTPDRTNTAPSPDASSSAGDADGASAGLDAASSINGDGGAATVIVHGGRRYAVGSVGDFVAIGDWDCDGEMTAAIVRPSTGAVTVFNEWPGAGKSVTQTQQWNVESPTGAEAVTEGACDRLRVYTTSGSQLFNPSPSG